jgi:hypothetical protein
LVDLTQIPDEQLKHTAWAGMLELTLKNAARQDLLLLIQNTIQQIKMIDQAHDLNYLMTMFNYMFEVGETSSPESFIQMLHNHLSPELEENVMTLAQQFEQKGRQEATQNLAINLLNSSLLSPEKIAALTELSLETVLTLQSKKKAH